MALDFASILNQTDPNLIYQQIADYFGVSMGVLLVVIAIISVWSLVWKGFALWKSARRNSPIWFVALLIVNTVGILEILYIYVFSEMGKKKKEEKKTEKKEEKKKK